MSCIGANICRVLHLQAYWNKEKCLTKIICHSQLECFKISKQQAHITSITKETMILWSPFNSETKIVTVSYIKLVRRLVEKFGDGFKTSANILQESNSLGQAVQRRIMYNTPALLKKDFVKMHVSYAAFQEEIRFPDKHFSWLHDACRVQVWFHLYMRSTDSTYLTKKPICSKLLKNCWCLIYQ